MDDKPGDAAGQSRPLVRPVVYRPSQAAPARKMPFNARHMPVGVSANTINVASHIRVQYIRRIVFFGIPITILVVVVIGVWLAALGLSPLTPKVITNGAFEYHFSYYKSAEPVNLALGEGLQDGNRSLVIAKQTTDLAYNDCSQVGDGWSRAFIAVIEGQERLVCTRSNKVYLVIFYHEEKRHLFEITYTSTQNGKSDEIRTIMSSLKVSIP